jgi:transcriptional regulator with XRE-family HTH domain
MTIGERLREERERLNLTQPAMAEAAGTTKQTQHAHETNRTPPKASYLAAIAELGVDVAYVVTGARASNAASTPTEMALLDNYRNSPEDVQRGVSKLLAETGRAVERASRKGTK